MLTERAEHATPFRRSDAMRLGAIAFVLTIVLGAMLSIDILAPAPLSIKTGDVAQSSIRAPRALTFNSAILTARAREAARQAVEPQYDYTADRAATIAGTQGVIFESVVTPVDAAFQAVATDAKLTVKERDALLGSVLPNLSATARATLLALTPERWKAVRTEAARVLDLAERAELRDSDIVLVRKGLVERMAGDLSAEEAAFAAEIVGALVVPNSSFSQALTKEARDVAARAVAPVRVSLQQNEVLVDAGHQVGELDMEKIEAFGLLESRPDYVRVGGLFLLAVLLVGLLLAWIQRFRPSFWHRNNVLLLISLVILVAAAGLKVIAGRSALPFLVPTAAVGILLAVLLDASTATLVAAVVAILAGVANGGSLELGTYVLLGGLAGIIGVRRGDRFERFVAAGFAVALVQCLTVATFSLLGTRDVTGILQLLAAAIASAGGAGVAAVGLFAVLGNLFGILTAFQLLELANPSQPLLRRLLVETPGTYHHSLMVGNLAESAAEAIGADTLLTRVAAYYHDIGKLANPLAFIENQAGGENIHDEMEPEASAQLLKQHVADGIDVAYAARLPTSIIAFIPQHHGTALMSYFHAKARSLAAEPFGGLDTAEGRRAADAVDPRRFRHAGPKPQSRVAALIMLADGVEASVRSLSSRDEAAIRAMVSRIIEERVADGQLDECDLTLRDIELVREAFVAQLLGMYHQRVPYPQNKIVELESRRASGTEG